MRSWDPGKTKLAKKVLPTFRDGLCEPAGAVGGTVLPPGVTAEAECSPLPGRGAAGPVVGTFVPGAQTQTGKCPGNGGHIWKKGKREY